MSGMSDGMDECSLIVEVAGAMGYFRFCGTAYFVAGARGCVRSARREFRIGLR